jgi:hypothetical protein
MIEAMWAHIPRYGADPLLGEHCADTDTAYNWCGITSHNTIREPYEKVKLLF